MKLHLIPFEPLILPPDIMLAFRHPQYFFAAGRARPKQLRRTRHRYRFGNHPFIGGDGAGI